MRCARQMKSDGPKSAAVFSPPLPSLRSPPSCADAHPQEAVAHQNLSIAPSAAGLSLKDLVKTTTYVTDIDQFFKHPEVRGEIFGRSLPTSATVEVRRLP
jgi:enamine deaminase RidA (YjgF/YER057c/UK114 family)